MYVLFHLHTKGIIQQQAVEEEQNVYIISPYLFP